MTKFSISIIIPHYNDWDSLQRLLRSIGSCDLVQVIVVDDGSDCNKKDSLEKYKDILFIENNSGKKGAGAARNIGLKRATNNFIIFADSDDVFLDGWYDLIHNSSSTLEEFDIIYFRPTSKHVDENVKSYRHVHINKMIDIFFSGIEESIRYYHYTPWSTLFKRELIVSKSLFFDEIVASNDINFMLKAGFYASRVGCSNRVFYSVTESYESLTKQRSFSVLNSRLEALINFNLFLINKNKKEYTKLMFFASSAESVGRRR
jgi:glycosyltransferase involved in cell wall biosynthesis